MKTVVSNNHMILICSLLPLVCGPLVIRITHVHRESACASMQKALRGYAYYGMTMGQKMHAWLCMVNFLWVIVIGIYYAYVT